MRSVRWVSSIASRTASSTSTLSGRVGAFCISARMRPTTGPLKETNSIAVLPRRALSSPRRRGKGASRSRGSCRKSRGGNHAQHVRDRRMMSKQLGYLVLQLSPGWDVAACGASPPLGLLVHRVVSVPVVTSRKPSPQAARALSIRSLTASAVIPGGPRSGSWSRQRHASSVASIPCGAQVRQVNPKTGKRPVRLGDHDAPARAPNDAVIGLHVGESF